MHKPTTILSLLIIGLLSGFNLTGQVTFYSGGEEVTDGACGISSLKMKVDLPAEASNYEKLEIFVQFLIPAYDNEEDSSPKYAVEIAKATIDKGVAEVSLKNTDGSSSLVRRGFNTPFDLEYYCTSELRWDEKMTLAVYVYGKTFSKWDWNSDGERYAVYNTTKIATHKDVFTMDFGPVSPVIQSENKVFAVKRYHINDLRLDIEGYNTPDEIDLHYLSNDDLSESIYFEAKAYASGATSIDELKTNATKLLLRHTNPEQSGFDTPEDFDMNSSAATGDYYYIPDLVVKANGYLKGDEALDELAGTFDFGAPQKSTPKKKGDRNKLIKSTLKDLNWKSGNVGNMKAEILEVEFYRGSQVEKKDDKSLKLKSGEKGNTSKLWVFVGDADGQAIFGFISQRGTTGALTAEQEEFVNSMLNDFKLL